MLIAVSNRVFSFENPLFKEQVMAQSPVLSFWAHSRIHGTPAKAFYYQIVQMK
jgi:hypothetical protein